MTRILENWPDSSFARNWVSGNITGPGLITYTRQGNVMHAKFTNPGTQATYDFFNAKDSLGSTTLPVAVNGSYMIFFLATPELVTPSTPYFRFYFAASLASSTNIAALRLSIEPYTDQFQSTGIIAISGGTTSGFNTYPLDHSKNWWKIEYATNSVVISNSADKVTWTVLETRGFSPGTHSSSVSLEFERPTQSAFFAGGNPDKPIFWWGPTLIYLPSVGTGRLTYAPNITGVYNGSRSRFAPPKSR